MQNDSRWLLALFGAMLCGLAAAESTSDALTRIEAETLLLKAREKQLEVQSNILTRENEIALKQGRGNALADLPTGEEPVVRGIEGLGATMYATLQLRDGRVLDVQAGDVVSDGMRIVSIRPNEVVVRTKRGKHVNLATAALASGPPQVNYPIGATALPPLPPAAPRGPMR
ncbi:MAG: hypothetical protein V7642_683 [Burkholderiales bacterium]|jgi:type IV pilus biogenesis protein PilP